MPVLPKDDAQKYQLAQIARTPNAQGDPLLSDSTILDIIVGIQDPSLEDAKKDKQWGDKLAINRLYTSYLSELENNPDIKTNMKAQNILAELRRLMASQLGQAGGPQSPTVPSTPTGDMSAENEGMGLPPTETGVPTSTTPPEMMGGVSGGAAGAGGY